MKKVTLNLWEWVSGFTGETKQCYTVKGERCEKDFQEYTTFLGSEEWELPEGYELGEHWNGEPIIYPEGNMQEHKIIETLDGMPCIWEDLNPWYLKKVK